MGSCIGCEDGSRTGRSLQLFSALCDSCARPATPVSDVRWRRNIFASKDSARAERRLRSLVSFHPRACAVF